ncbi:MAG: hypothetical protein LH679_10895 [Cyanobacteria bacterium CAN_BIN43]|nr:hypothetical protein [Cyanobacteria bacterium CAN_BIN43]
MRRGLLVSLILLVSPWISVKVAVQVASDQGCQLNEAQAYPCNVAGHGMGRALQTMGMMGWLGVMTFMPSVAGLVIALSMKDQSQDNVR